MRLSPAEVYLDEIAIQPDPIAWTTVGGLRFTTWDTFHAFKELEEDGLICPAGMQRDQWKETTYKLTAGGREFWETFIKGYRKRDPGADKVPTFSKAKMAVAHSPRSVFDLARVPWHWDKPKEQKARGSKRAK